MINLIDNERYNNGLSWDSYLDEGVAAEASHRKRFEEVPNQYALSTIKQSAKNYRALLLTDPRCGDCAWCIPRIARLLEDANVELRIFNKNENPDLMDKLETNGKRSVPKLALIDEQGNMVKKWGPRPSEIQEYVEKSVNVIPTIEWKAKVNEFYRNEGVEVLYKEISGLFA